MIKSRFSILLLAMGAMAMTGSALAQDAAKKAAPKPAAKAADAAPAAASPAKEIYPQSHFDFLLKERLATGQTADSPQVREMIRDELINRELVTREAKKKNLLTPTTFSLLHATDFADRLYYQIIPPLNFRRVDNGFYCCHQFDSGVRAEIFSGVCVDFLMNRNSRRDHRTTAPHCLYA